MPVKNVVLVSGKLQSGKNTFTDLVMKWLHQLRPELSIDFDFFARSVKDQSKDIFKVLIEYLNEISEEYGIRELKTEESNWYGEKNKITRILLQTYGTDIFRDMIDSDHWAKILRNRLQERNEDILFITDVRFKSEMTVICDRTPYIHNYRTVTPNYNITRIRVERSTYERTDDPIFTHHSEIDLDDYTNWNFLIKNDETLVELDEKAKQVAMNILESFYD